MRRECFLFLSRGSHSDILEVFCPLHLFPPSWGPQVHMGRRSHSAAQGPVGRGRLAGHSPTAAAVTDGGHHVATHFSLPHLAAPASLGSLSWWGLPPKHLCCRVLGGGRVFYSLTP